MRNLLRLVPLPLLLTQVACSMRPVEAANPRPADVLLRVTVFSACLSATDCADPAIGHRKGTLVFADTDSLVMFDLRAAERVTIRPAAGVLLEVYQGQRRTSGAIAKGTAKGAAVGAAVGVGEALLHIGLTKLLGGEVDMSEAVKGGLHIGVLTGAYAGGKKGADEGEAVWERVTLLQLRQQLCRCANPDPPKTEPAVRLIPEG